MHRHPAVRQVFLVVVLVSVLGGVGCSGGEDLPGGAGTGAGRDQPTPRMTFEEMFEVLGTVVLEENDEVVNVRPTLTLDPDGGLLVSDAGAFRVRRYTDAGGLLWQFGREGPGPEEFGVLRSVVRDRDGLIVALDGSRKMVFWDEGPRAVATVLSNIEAGPLVEADPLPDGRILLSTRYSAGAPEAGLVQVFDPETEKVDLSFLTPNMPEFLQRAAANAGWAASDLRGDTIASIYAWSDTIYLHTLDGHALQPIPMPPFSFVKATSAPDPTARFSDWLYESSRIQVVEWLPDGRFLVSYGGAAQGTDYEYGARYHVLLMDRDGRGLGDVVDAPQFKSVGHDETFYFADPNSLEPNRLLHVRLRTSDSLAGSD